MVYLPNATPMTLNVLGWFSQWTRSIASPLQGRQEPENNSIKDPNWGIESFLGLVTSSPTTISYGPPGQNTAIAFGVSVDIGAVNVRVGDSSPTPTAASAFTSTTIGREQPAEAAQPSSSLDEQSIFDSTCSPEPYEIPPLAVPALPAPDAALATVYRYRKQQGVNLGSWFLLEGWMVPSLFTCASGPAISELDVAKGWNGQSKAVLERHWDNFITEDDFAWLAGIGINTLRLPLGYWHIGNDLEEWIMGTPYEDVRQNYIGAWPRVLRAVEWAARHGIGILIDLHGAPGSQNGQHHSGVSDEQTGLFSSPENVQKTISVLKFLTETFINVPNVVGIQLLNEPIDSPETFDFYNVALDSLRGMDLTGIKSFPFYIHDAFNLQRGADLIRSRGAEWNVLDHHSYYVFTAYDSSRSASAHTADLGPTGVVGSELRDVGQSLNGNLITGEWSCALSEDSLKMESDPISARRQFCEVQEQAYQKSGSGSFFWSFKKENCEEGPSWCFQSAVGKSLPVSFFSFEGLTVPKNLDSIVSGGTVLSQSDDRKGPASRPPSKKTIRQVSALASSRPRNRTVPKAALSASAQFGARSPSNVSAMSRSRNIPDAMSFLGGVRLRHGSRPALHHRGSSIHQRRMNYAGSPAHRRTDTTEPAISAEAGRDISPPASGPPSTVSSGSESPVIEMPPSSDVALPLSTPATQSTATVDSPALGSTLTAAQQAIQRGFSDGFATAKLFAQHGPGMSRLGSRWQYVENSLVAHGPEVIKPGKEGYYREWFDKGLTQGEKMIEQVVAKLNSAG